ncbi:PREDICTED: actin-related protein 8-like [Populus euphratica]|uniref:Actin-related protein 8-like n=1 Tax=Populus euphratica TaxID=75702 RepID=A0AAJ6TAA2_POPEU|nr:PREDICTED: actin-related protein 8-like [Populus euphratica]
MAMLLKKVWESVTNRRSSCPSSHVDSVISAPGYTKSPPPPSSLGAFDRLPIDVVFQIVKLVGPKDAARLSVVCKPWRSLVSDDRLWIYFLQSYHDTWNSVFFAETNLQKFSSHIAKSSFMRIYRQRVQVPGAVIVDGGSGYYKFGWSKYACPSGRSATFSEFVNIESPSYFRFRNFFSTIYSRMQVKASAQPIVLSLPLRNYDDTESARVSRRQLKEAIYTALFDMDVPAVCAVNQATLALYAAQRTSGIVVNIGFQVTSVVPILHGKVMRTVGVEVVDVGGLKLTEFLREQMQRNNINFRSLYTARTLKEKLCYVAADYEVELSRDTPASLEVPGEGWFALSKERFTTGEVLFQPHIAGVHTKGLHEAVALCMDHCHAIGFTGDDTWFKTVVLSGGTALLPGLVGRLEKELNGLLPSSISKGIRVISPAYGADTAWFGAKLISNLSTFPESWCVTNKQFRRKPRLNLVW